MKRWYGGSGRTVTPKVKLIPASHHVRGAGTGWARRASASKASNRQAPASPRAIVVHGPPPSLLTGCVGFRAGEADALVMLHIGARPEVAQVLDAR